MLPYLFHSVYEGGGGGGGVRIRIGKKSLYGPLRTGAVVMKVNIASL